MSCGVAPPRRERRDRLGGRWRRGAAARGGRLGVGSDGLGGRRGAAAAAGGRASGAAAAAGGRRLRRGRLGSRLWASACAGPAAARGPRGASAPRWPCRPRPAASGPGPRARWTRRTCPPPHLLERRQQLLAGDPEFLRQFVDPHASPIRSISSISLPTSSLDQTRAQRPAQRAGRTRRQARRRDARTRLAPARPARTIDPAPRPSDHPHQRGLRAPCPAPDAGPRIGRSPPRHSVAGASSAPRPPRPSGRAPPPPPRPRPSASPRARAIASRLGRSAGSPRRPRLGGRAPALPRRPPGSRT